LKDSKSLGDGGAIPAAKAQRIFFAKTANFFRLSSELTSISALTSFEVGDFDSVPALAQPTYTSEESRESSRSAKGGPKKTKRFNSMRENSLCAGTGDAGPSGCGFGAPGKPEGGIR
jgi:hypothetical protein